MAELRTDRHLTADLMFPLRLFYDRVERPVPAIERMQGIDLPQPQQRLLVHHGDMTPTLEQYHGDKLFLRLLDRFNDDEGYLRQVVLLRESDQQPVEFGAIRIVLPRFDMDVQRLIREGRTPLGAILGDRAVVHRSQPVGYFRIEADAWISSALAINAEKHPVLFGRRNVLLNHADQALADVVEVLPPASAKE